MLEKLNTKQMKLMTTVKNEWLHRFFDCKLRTNRKQATKYINWLYELSGYKKPLIVFLSSPLGLQCGANMTKNNGDQVWSQVGDQVRNQVGSQVGSQVWSQVRSQVWSQVRNQVWSQVGNQVGSQVGDQVGNQVGDQVGNQVWSQVGNQVGSQVGDQVRNQVGSQVGSQVWSQVRSQVRNQVGDQKLEYFSFCSYGSITDYGWNSFYDFFTRIKIINNEKFNNFMFLLKSGIYDMIQFEKICFVSDMPTKITRDEQQRLHNENDVAIQWSDGYGQYWWHGVSVSEKIILHPEKLTKKDWMDEKNIEVRRCIQEKLGERFVKMLKGKTIHKGKRGTLIEIDLKDDPDKVAHYVKVKDTSTERQYYLRIPPTIMDADEGVSWSFSRTTETYKPIKES